MNMKEKIVARIKERGSSGVSFVELESIGGFKGDLDFGCSENNIIGWQNVSGEAIDAIFELLEERVIDVNKSNEFVYMFDGRVINLPIAESADEKYDQPTWLPLVFCIPNESTD